ncbi:PDZK1-interacting protein 1 [Nematolebias whitei]|uniref:PDZK1-interacting protein 1 n=1 Tax=Nematolebias whitei TaxID=451745 RepID=UPI001898CCB0|nr:PDZK1-interacting protein 1 [Nematolebias whitei]
MGNGSVLMFSLLLLIGTVMAQSASAYSERLLPQWLTGIIAVSSFLILTFIGFMVKKMWCEKSSGTDPSVESVRPNKNVESNLYETKLEVLGSNSVQSNNENHYEPCDEYETSLNVLRSNSVQSNNENHYEPCDEYETSLNVLRSHSRRNVYDNRAIDRTEDKATSM